MNNVNPMLISYQPMQMAIEQTLEKIYHMREINPNYSVIDLGGHMGGWSWPVCDLVVDIQSQPTDKTIPLDLCVPSDWDTLLRVVEQRGQKFDFAICTHTLEDLYDPIITLRRLPLVAHAGIISMPSLRTELSHVENYHWLGYIHHRWIFDQVDGRMLVMPKLPFLEQRYQQRVAFDPQIAEICYQWQHSLDFEIISNNFFPSAEAIVNMYDQAIHQALS